MLSAIISRFVILLFGTLYPAYASYKAVRTKNVKEYVKWMMYWIVFAFFTCAETFTDVFLSFWFPFYYEIKVVIVVWLLSPATKGSSILYRNFVHPMLIKREQEIDEYISKAKEQGYHTMLDLGSRGVSYATNVIMQTAIKGGGGIVNQLRRSYSLSDLSEETDYKADLNRNNKLQTDSVDAHAADVLRDPRLRTSRKPVGSRIDLYFPEMDVDVRSHHPHELPISLSQIRSSEDISSGYSSAEPLYGESQAGVEGNPLVRTASVGATRPRAVRGRAAVQPKKGLATEGERDEMTADQGWQQPLLSLPADSLFPVHPAGSSPKAVLSPEALHFILTNYINSGNVPLHTLVTNETVEIILDDKESMKEEDFEDAELEYTLESTDSVVLKESVISDEDEKISDFTLKGHIDCNELTERIVVKDKIASGSPVEDKGIGVRDVIKDKDTMINDSHLNDKIMGVSEENVNIDIGLMIKNNTLKNDITLVAEECAVKYESDNLDAKCLQPTDIPNTMLTKTEYKQEEEIGAKEIVDIAESTKSTQSETSIAKLEGTSVNEVELTDECFEDACDNVVLPNISLDKTLTNISSLQAEIIKSTALDGLTLTSIAGFPTNNEIDQTQSLQPTTYLESFDSSNDLNFEDTLPDVSSVISDDNLDNNDRKGKYNKTRAPPPPETTNTEEICKELQSDCLNVKEPDLLMESSLSSSQDLKYKLLNEQKFDNSVPEDNLKWVETSSKNVPYEKQEASPSPSYVKKDSSNFSKFLPKSGMSSLFSLWGSKDDASRRSPTRKSPTPEVLSSSPSNITKHTPESGIHSHSLAEELQRKTKTKLKIRQMSQSPSRGRRLHLE